MPETIAEDPIGNTEWDQKYFKLILELEEKNASRYEMQTEQILRKGSLRVEFGGAEIKFKITPTGCEYSISDDTTPTTSRAWHRMGWGKSAKRRALPNYFAQAEASVIINREA